MKDEKLHRKCLIGFVLTIDLTSTFKGSRNLDRVVRACDLSIGVIIVYEFLFCSGAFIFL